MNEFNDGCIKGESVTEEPLLAIPHLKLLSTSVKSTPEIEKKYVHRVYDAIAPHFSSTRFAKWPKVATFLNSLPLGSLVLDAGCGNGKYLGLNPNCFFIGCDISAPLIGICADRGNEVLVADAVILPCRTGYADAAISIAVLHHLSTENRRKKAIDELIRVVKKGGLVLITVWAVEQEDRTLLNKWTPLSSKYFEEWIGPGSPRVRTPSSSFAMESIPEGEVGGFENQPLEKIGTSSQNEEPLVVAENKGNQFEYFDEWIGPGSPRVRTPSSSLAMESIPEGEVGGFEDQPQEKIVMSSQNEEPLVVAENRGNQFEYFDEWIGPGSPRVRTPSTSLAMESIPEGEVGGFEDQPQEKIVMSSQSEEHLVVAENRENQWEYFDEWIGPGSPRVRTPLSSLALESIPEGEVGSFEDRPREKFDKSSQNEEPSMIAENGENQQEYFVPWHLPYHRTEVSGASSSAVANGLAKKDDKKGAVVYNRYYHVFSEGELERLVFGMENAVVVDRFYDKSNWCIILQKTE